MGSLCGVCRTGSSGVSELLDRAEPEAPTIEWDVGCTIRETTGRLGNEWPPRRRPARAAASFGRGSWRFQVPHAFHWGYTRSGWKPSPGQGGLESSCPTESNSTAARSYKRKRAHLGPHWLTKRAYLADQASVGGALC